MQYWGATADDGCVKGLIPQLESKLDGHEAILGRRKYLDGNVRSFVPFVRRAVNTDGLTDYLAQEVTLANLFHLSRGTFLFDDLGLGNLDRSRYVKRQADAFDPLSGCSGLLRQLSMVKSHLVQTADPRGWL
jgi:hypothetical protein